MYMFKRLKGASLSRLLLVISAGLFIAGCAEVGGRQLSLLTSSEVLDPLEVPPGLSPLPEAEQFQVPEELDSADIKELPPEQFRNYESWVSFEKFRQFQLEEQGVGLSAEEYSTARKRGEGRFRVVTRRTPEDKVRLHVVDQVEPVWDRLRPVLEDMGIVINNTNVQERVYYVSNVPSKKKPTLTQRFGFKEFAGEVNSLHVVAVSDTETEVIGKSERNVEVEFEAAVEFFTRMRYFMLTYYQVDEGGVDGQFSVEVNKRFERDGKGSRIIVVSENFDSAWVRVGRTLEASGVDIEDLNRSEGVYIVSYSATKKKKKRFKLAFWRKSDEQEIVHEQFDITVSGSGQQSVISVLPSGSEESDIQSAEKLLQIIYERLYT
jgi:uncharacterized lipoprotein